MAVNTTLTPSLEEFGDTPSASLTPAQFLAIDLGGEADPPAFQRAQVSVNTESRV